MSTINQALKQLKEDWDEKDILPQETVDSLNKELEDLKVELQNINKLPRDQYDDNCFARWKEVTLRIREIQQLLNKHNLTQRYFTSSDELATDEDWEELLDRLPNEFEFEDLEVEVETEEDDEPVGWNYRTDSIIYKTYPAQHGYVNSWTLTIDPTEEIVARYLNKPLEDITKRDLAAIDEDDYYEFIVSDDECISKACEEAENNWEYDDVRWDEPPEPDYDDYYDDRD